MSQLDPITLHTPNLSITNFGLPSLHVLRDEIVVTLKDTETHLSEFNDDSEQARLLLDSASVLMQLSRIFELISLTGAQMLSKAIAGGLQKLYDNGDNNDSALIMDLSEAIMTLDRYVEFVLLTETIEPSLLLPIINTLHKATGQPELEKDVFANFGSSSVVIANPEQNFQSLDDLSLDRDLLSHAYRSGLFIALTCKGQTLSDDEQRQLKAMSAACMAVTAQTSSLFWQAAAAAVMDIEQILPLTPTQKHTLVYLEQQFHNYMPVMDTRFADLVTLACQRRNALAGAIRDQYAHNQLEAEQRDKLRSFLFGPNRQITDTLNELIQHQINEIKDKVDEYARGESIHDPQMQAKQIADEMIVLKSTLQLLGLGSTANALQSAAHAIVTWQTPTPSDFDMLLIALMGAENATIAMTRQHTPGAVSLPLHNNNISLHQLNTAYDTLVEESRTTIASAEQAISDYIADDSREIFNITNIPEMLRQVSGAIRFLNLPVAASLLSQLSVYLDRRLTMDTPLDDKTLGYIADVMMSVDYRLDSFEHNRPISNQSLDVAQNSLSHLLAA
ncbi:MULTISPECIES: hypothetical protein [unclassified Psychrobacter]|uniref:hypothetical protein n=1 Tax=unclassified Psychrobacter TaxID=196806 RepID=UPI0018F7C8F8|nr:MULTISPECIES: hypothetical protein [unclassified Psychrobacter]